MKMKEEDFVVYNQCIENSSNFEIEELSVVPSVEETFLKFVKYINILDNSDIKKSHGQKLINIIYKTGKF
jgi:hypothetical protein